MTKRFDGKADEEAVSFPLLDPKRPSSADPCPGSSSKPLYPTVQAGPSVGGDDEAAKIAAMFQAEADQWQATQETMATYVLSPPSQVATQAPKLTLSRFF